MKDLEKIFAPLAKSYGLGIQQITTIILLFAGQFTNYFNVPLCIVCSIAAFYLVEVFKEVIIMRLVNLAWVIGGLVIFTVVIIGGLIYYNDYFNILYASNGKALTIFLSSLVSFIFSFTIGYIIVCSQAHKRFLNYSNADMFTENIFPLLLEGNFMREDIKYEVKLHAHDTDASSKLFATVNLSYLLVNRTDTSHPATIIYSYKREPLGQLDLCNIDGFLIIFDDNSNDEKNVRTQFGVMCSRVLPPRAKCKVKFQSKESYSLNDKMTLITKLPADKMSVSYTSDVGDKITIRPDVICSSAYSLVDNGGTGKKWSAGNGILPYNGLTIEWMEKKP
jgi:hypothetical protein